MALGQRLRQARLEAGLSQRQLCGEEITRNMLSQIENGAARPSMDTLCYLAARLGKSVSWFLEEDTAPAEQRLLDRAEQAIADGKLLYAAELLRQAEAEQGPRCDGALRRRRLLLLARVQPEKAEQIVKELPSVDEELLLRAKAALQQGNADRCLALLAVVEDQTAESACMLGGDAHFSRGEYAAAIRCYEKVEHRALDRLEQCYEQLGDYKRAYYYAKMRR